MAQQGNDSKDSVQKLWQQSSIPALPQLALRPKLPSRRVSELGDRSCRGKMLLSASGHSAEVVAVYEGGQPANTTRRRKNQPLSLELAGPLTSRKFETNDKLAALAATAAAGRMYGAGEDVHLVHDHIGKDGTLLKSAPKLAEQRGALGSAEGGADEDSNGPKEIDGNISTWPSSKTGSKPNLLQHMETFVHEQLTVIHHSQGQDREMISVMRAEMVKYCLDTFGKHFRTYRDIFDTLYSSVDGLLALFEFHKDEIFKLRQNAEAREVEFTEKMTIQEEVESDLRGQIEQLRDVAERFGPLEEDRKVLRAQTEDLQRQLLKLRNHVETLNEKEEYFRSRHITHTIREVRMRNKNEELEEDAKKLRKSLEEALKARSETAIRSERLEVDIERANQERDHASNRLAPTLTQLGQAQEELKMLRYERKKLHNQINSSRGGGSSVILDGPMDMGEMSWGPGGQLSPRGGGASADRLTPRPDWAACEDALGDMNLEVAHDHNVVQFSPLGSSSRKGHLLADGDDTTPRSKSESTSALLAGFSHSPKLGSVAHNTNPKSTSNKLMSVTNAILNLQEELKQARGRSDELEGEILVIRQVNELEAQPQEMDGAALAEPRTPREASGKHAGGHHKKSNHGGDSAFPSSPLTLSVNIPTSPGAASGKHRNKTLSQLEDKIFVPCGNAGDIPKYLHTASDNYNIRLKPMTLPTLLDQLEAAQTFIATKYIGLSPDELGVKEKLQDHLDLRNLDSSVNAPGASPLTFADGFYQWLLSTQAGQEKVGGNSHSASQIGRSARRSVGKLGASGKDGDDGGKDDEGEPSVTQAKREESAAAINSELAYSLVYLAQHTYAANVYCKIFLFQLSGEIPISSFMWLRAHQRDLRRSLESMDLHGTNTIFLPEAMPHLKKDLKYLSDHDIKVLTELAKPRVPPSSQWSSPNASGFNRSSLGQSGSTPKKSNPSRLVNFVSGGSENKEGGAPTAADPAPVFFPPLLQRDHPFTQTFSALFLSSILYQHLQLTRAIRDLPYAEEDNLSLTTVQGALCGADSQCSPDVMRWFLAKCLRLKGPNQITAKTKVNTGLMLFRIKEVFLRRATPMNVGLFNLDSVDPPLLAQLQVQAALHSYKPSSSTMGASGIGAEGVDAATAEVLAPVKGGKSHKAGQKRVVAGNRK